MTDEGADASRAAVRSIQLRKEGCVIVVTDEAKGCIRAVNTSVGLPEGLVLRLDRTRTGSHGERRLAVSVEEPREGDQPVEHEGEDLLRISGAVSAACDGCVLALGEAPQGRAFSS